MKTIGIKLADGTFYPILEEGSAEKKHLNLTTVKDNQTTVQVDLYRSESGSMEDAEYVDTLEIKNLIKHPNGEPDISLDISVDENNELKAELHDPETGKESTFDFSLISKPAQDLEQPSDIAEAESFNDALDFSTDDFSIPDDFSNDEQAKNDTSDNAVAMASGTGLLGTAMALANKNKDAENTETLQSESLEPIEDLEEPVTEESSTEDDLSITEDEISLPEEDLSISEDDLSLPTEVENSTEVENTNDFSIDDFSIPDDFESSEKFEIPELEELEEPIDDSTEDSIEELSDDLNFDTENDKNDDLFVNSDFIENEPVSSTLDFSDLLDEETKEGRASDTLDSESIRKKTKTPVIICIVCAIICVIAAILTLFVIPSKLNIINKCQNPTVEKNTKIEEPEIQKPDYSAKENEIVIAPAEEVVPEVPAKEIPESKNISYKIKWGDTLWDIAKSYYNNPWKYHKIAKFNGIKNPDHIISGTTIVIPAE